MTTAETATTTKTETALRGNPEIPQETGNMKNSKEYGAKIDKFIRLLRSGQKVGSADFADPLDALIYGLISEFTMERQAKKIFKSLQSHFIDYNDLRVSRSEEIQEILEETNQPGEQVAVNLARMLSAVFDKYDELSLKTIDEQGKRQAKKELEELNGTTHFAVNFCFLAALQGHAIPLTETMIGFLKSQDLIHPEATLEEIEAFFERHLPASRDWEFYELLRQAAETGSKKSVLAKEAAKAPRKKPAAKKKNK
jgi:endonuclease III